MSRNDWYDDPSTVNEPWCLDCGSYSRSMCICVEVDGEIVVPDREDDSE